MKKLIIMAIVAVAAVCTQAAQFSWQGTYTKDASGALAADGLPVYLFVASSTGVGYDVNDTVLSVGSWTLDNLSTAVSGGTFLSEGWLDKSVGLTQVENKSFSGLSQEYTGINNGTGVLLAAVFVDSTSMAPDVKAAYLANGDITNLDIVTGLGEWLSGYTSYTGLTYTTQTVPEPTSGFLILLGMAGLALRRRHA